MQGERGGGKDVQAGGQAKTAHPAGSWPVWMLDSTSPACSTVVWPTSVVSSSSACCGVICFPLCLA